MNELLSIRGLQVDFDTEDGPVHAVNGLDLDVGRGETVAVVGESGSGKSVSMLAAMGLLPEPPAHVSAEHMTFDGRDLRSLGPRAMRQVRGNDISMVFQDPMTSLHPLQRIGAQIMEPLRHHRSMSHADARRRCIELLDLVGIPSPEQRISEYPHQFSGGMRQRAMIAMALACEPKLLIADEPTTALDVTIQDQIVDLVNRIQDESGMSVIWITHDLGLVAGIADRIVVMYSGRLVERGHLDEMYDHPAHPYTRGLLRSLPRLDERLDDRLASIPGAPPDARVVATGCPFAPRCDHHRPRCDEAVPDLIAVGEHHEARCLPEVVATVGPRPSTAEVAR